MYSVKMNDMAKTPAEVKDDMTPMAFPDIVNRYPYGLCISLDEDTLAKLDLPGDCDVGDMVHIFAMARVTSKSENEKADGTKCCRIELQITHMGVEDEDMEDAA